MLFEVLITVLVRERAVDATSREARLAVDSTLAKREF